MATGTAGPDVTVTGVSPASGPTDGGDTVTITGAGFTGATAVSFGGTSTENFTIDSGSQITAISPSGTGTVDITVTTPDGTTPTGPADQFTYTGTAATDVTGTGTAGPDVTGVSPSSGSAPETPSPSQTSVSPAPDPQDSSPGV